MAHDKFLTIVNTINEALVSAVSDPESRREYFNSWEARDGRGAGSPFSRKTPLDLRSMFWLIAGRMVRSLSVGLDAFFGTLGLPVPTKSAFSMKRTLVRSGFFAHVNSLAVSGFYSLPGVRTWKGYVLLACDGTRLALPDVREIGDCFGYYHTPSGAELYPSARGTIFQDTLNDITVLARIEEKDTDEKRTFEKYFEEAAGLVGRRSIMLADRGYFSYLLMHRMNASGQFFVMKAKTTPWSRRFLDSGKKEAVVEIVPSRSTSVYSDPGWRGQAKKTVTARLVRFDHPNGEADVLVTNIMDRGVAGHREVVRLYRLRWPAETSYGVYKNDMALELFSSFRADGVRQDFYAAVILYNLASVMAADADPHKKNYKPDMNVVVGLLHNLCPHLALQKDSRVLKRLLATTMRYASRCLGTVMENRSFPRIRRLRKTSGKFYRQTNFSIAV